MPEEVIFLPTQQPLFIPSYSLMGSVTRSRLLLPHVPSSKVKITPRAPSHTAAGGLSAPPLSSSVECAAAAWLK